MVFGSSAPVKTSELTSRPDAACCSHNDGVMSAKESGECKRVLGVLAGDDVPPNLKAWLVKADLILAADGGADTVSALDVKPDWVIGDLDSLKTSRESFGRVEQDLDQSTTDCDKLLSLASRLGVARLTLTCVEGRRPDHFLATLQSAARSSLEISFAFRQGMGWIVRPGLTREIETTGKVSLLPLTACTGVGLAGMKWELSGVDMSPVGLTSISNQGVGLVRASVESGVALLYAEDVSEPWPAG